MNKARINPDQAVAAAITHMKDVHDIIAAENDALDKLDTKTFLALQDEKTMRVRTYQNTLINLRQNRDSLKTVSPLLKKQLEDTQVEFALIARKNLEALARMNRVSERFKETLHRAAQKAHKNKITGRYTESGEIDARSKRNASMGVSDTA